MGQVINQTAIHKTGVHGQVGVTTATTQLFGLPTPCVKGIFIQNDSSSADSIHLCSSAGSKGIKIAAGDKEFVPVDDLSLVYLACPSSTATVYYSAY